MNIEKKRVIFYIDGFNFYYGLKAMAKIQPDWRKFYWIDFVKLFSEYLKDDEQLIRVMYFTARPKNYGKTVRQNNLMNANKQLNQDKLKIIYGKYQDKPMICRAADGCKKTFMHWEEKQTDVALAVKIIEDCHNNLCDKIVLVSADSDFVPPLRLIKDHYKEKEVLVLLPPTKHSNELTNVCGQVYHMGQHKPKWNRAKLEDVFEVTGKTYRKPIEWTQ